MKEEIMVLHKNSTWTLVPHEPHMNVVDCMWVFRIKLNVDGTIDRHKVCLVAKGNVLDLIEKKNI